MSDPTPNAPGLRSAGKLRRVWAAAGLFLLSPGIVLLWLFGLQFGFLMGWLDILVPAFSIVLVLASFYFANRFFSAKKDSPVLFLAFVEYFIVGGLLSLVWLMSVSIVVRFVVGD